MTSNKIKGLLAKRCTTAEYVSQRWEPHLWFSTQWNERNVEMVSAEQITGNLLGEKRTILSRFPEKVWKFDKWAEKRRNNPSRSDNTKASIIEK